MEGQTINLLSDQALREELANNLPEILSQPAIFKDFRLKFLSLSFSSRQSLAQDIIAILKANNQAIGQALVTQKGLRLPPTLANWLVDYVGFAAGYFSEAKREEYLKTSEKENLAAKERTILANLFDLYGFFFQMAKNPESLDAVLVKDKAGRLKLWQNGILKEMGVSAAMPPSPAVPPPGLPLSEETKAAGQNPPPQDAEILTVASFPFEPEDETEIKNHADNLSQFKLPETYGVAEIIQKISAQYQLTFREEIFYKRFVSIATARLKEIRNQADTLDLLTRSAKIGGLEYLPELAEKILEDLDKEIPKLHQVKPPEKAKPENIPLTPQEALKKSLVQANVFPAPAQGVAPPQEPPVAPESFFPKPPIFKPKEIKTMPIRPEQALYERAMRVMDQEKNLESQKSGPGGFAPAEEGEEKASRPKMWRPPASSAKPRLEDIKGRPKIFGPIEELRTLTVKDFRRLVTAKATAAQRIADKIGLLKEDSFGKFAEGLKAWRTGEVYQLYLSMGTESMEKGRTIRETIESRAKAGRPYFSEQEFNSIVDLNRKLRF